MARTAFCAIAASRSNSSRVKSTFVETCWLLIYGELPTREQLKAWSELFTRYEMIHEGLYHHFDGFPSTGHPMAILSAMINAMSCYEPGLMEMESPATFQISAARLISKLRTIAAAAYKASIGQPIIYPKPHLDYCTNFLHMMFSIPFGDYEPDPETVAALQLILILHADHEQNCSSSTVRMVASSGANLFASCAAGVCALWGPLHGGANAAVVEMLQRCTTTTSTSRTTSPGSRTRTPRSGSWGSATGSTRATTPGPAS